MARFPAETTHFLAHLTNTLAHLGQNRMTTAKSRLNKVVFNVARCPQPLTNARN